MKVVHARDVEYAKLSGHREGDIAFKRLISGTPGRPDNFELSLVRQRGHYATPRHRHNYDQYRYVLEGEYHYAGHRIMRAGTIGYFPEGTPYGPQEVKDCVVLAVQFGGISGQGILDYDALRRGHAELAATGRFEKGIYYRGGTDERPAGEKKQKDGYEAIWEHVNGRDLVYAPQRYHEPVVCDPAALAWEATGETGVSEKNCGRFAGRTGMSLIRIEAGATSRIAAGGGAELLFVLDGGGSLGEATLETQTAAALAPGEAADLVARQNTVAVRLALPRVGPPSA